MKRTNPYGYPNTTFHDDDMSSLTNSFTPRTPPRNIKKDNIPVSPLTPNTVDEPKPPKGPYPGTNRPMPPFPQFKLPEIQKSNKKSKNNGGKKKTKKTKKKIIIISSNNLYIIIKCLILIIHYQIKDQKLLEG